MLTRRFALGLSLVLAAACGGKDSTGPTTTPPPAFPAVGGIYSFSATFDGFTFAQAHAAGSITLGQVSRDVGTLTGSIDFTTTIGGAVNHGIVTLSNASVTPQGVVSFIGSDTQASWTFTGTVSGLTVTGRHTLTDGVSSFSGDWTATRPSTATAQLSASAAPSAAPTGRVDDVIGALTTIR